MAPTNNSDMQTLLNSLNLLTEQVTNMGQQITDLQRQRQPAPSGTPAPTTITSTFTGTSDGTQGEQRTLVISTLTCLCHGALEMS